MIVIDASSFITLTIADSLPAVLDEFDVHTTETVIQELQETAEYDDVHGNAARTVLERADRITVHATPQRRFQSSRVDPGEGSCALLTHELDTDFLITDDLRALPELQTIADAKIAISPILLKALVRREKLERDEALEKLEQIAVQRDWLGAPIYRRACHLFDEDNT